MGLRPRGDRGEDGQQRLPERREPVVDPGRHGGRHRTRDDAVAFEPAQRLGQHLLGHAGDGAGQFAVAARRALGPALRRAGHTVTEGERDGLAAAARTGEIVVNALPGAVSLEVLTGLRDDLTGRILIDVANPVRIGPDGFAAEALYPGDSLARRLQEALPATRVVKTLNTVGPAALMAAPTSLSAPLTAFLSGDDAGAKEAVAGLLRDLGWPSGWIVGLGGVDTAWWPESCVLMVRGLVTAFGPVPFGLSVAR